MFRYSNLHQCFSTDKDLNIDSFVFQDLICYFRRWVSLINRNDNNDDDNNKNFIYNGVVCARKLLRGSVRTCNPITSLNLEFEG